MCLQYVRLQSSSLVVSLLSWQFPVAQGSGRSREAACSACRCQICSLKQVACYELAFGEQRCGAAFRRLLRFAAPGSVSQDGVEHFLEAWKLCGDLLCFVLEGEQTQLCFCFSKHFATNHAGLRVSKMLERPSQNSYSLFLLLSHLFCFEEVFVETVISK